MEKKKIVPEITESPKIIEQDPVGHTPGNYLLEQPDGVVISVTPRMYDRVYKNHSDFKVKKSPNQ